MVCQISSVLFPGQWITIEHDRKKVPDQVRGSFKVISLECSMSDGFRYFLMNVNGDLLNYSTNQERIGAREIPFGSNIKIISKEEVTQIFGESLQKLEAEACNHLKKLAQCKYFGHGFNPQDEKTVLNGEQVRMMYNLP